MEDNKICPKCSLNKNISEFYKRGRGGFSTDCKSCFRVKQALYYKKTGPKSVKYNPDKVKKYTVDESIIAKICRNCYKEKGIEEFYKSNHCKGGYNHRCRDCQSIYHKKYNKKTNFRNNYRAKNIKKARLATNNWSKKNKEHLKKYDKERKNTNLNYKITRKLRTRFYIAFTKGYKNSSVMENLGCSIEKLKLWLEMHWQEDMSWDNYSKDGWHIDHIRPLDNFDLTNLEEVRTAWNFTNLQPLWAKDNLIKSNKILIGDNKL